MSRGENPGGGPETVGAERGVDGVDSVNPGADRETVGAESGVDGVDNVNPGADRQTPGDGEKERLGAFQWVYRLILLAAGWGFLVWNDFTAVFWLLGITIHGYICGRLLGRIMSVSIKLGIALGGKSRPGRMPGNAADTGSGQASEDGEDRRPGYVSKKRKRSRPGRRVLLAVMIVIPVVCLTTLKYGGMITGDTLLIPLGLSYYTLMVVGYLIDVYRGRVKAEKNPIIFALYTGFFPQLTAGPIGRSEALLSQYRRRIRLAPEDLKAGFLMILLGTFEKYVLADNLHQVVDGLVAGTANGLPIIIAMLLFSLVIYYDFAGYSLIALGCGRLLGIRLQENFRSPYLATSIREFWRRWHISLSSWFRDYLYIPLGGSRVSPVRRDINTLIVFTVSGAWHGQQAGFWLWGLIHGAYLVIENRLRGIRGARGADKKTFGPSAPSADVAKVSGPSADLTKEMDPSAGERPAGVEDRVSEKKPNAGKSNSVAAVRVAKRIGVFLLVSAAWVPFYAGKLWKTGELFGRMFSGSWSEFTDAFLNGFGLRKEIWLIVGCGVLFFLWISHRQEKESLRADCSEKKTACFWTDYYDKISAHGWLIFILGIVIFTVLLLAGVYGSEYDASTFIYGGF